MTPTPDEPGTKAPEPYKTSDTPYAAFLHYSGYRLITSQQDPNDYKREVMIFVFDEQIPALEKEWRLGKAIGDLKKYHRSLKIVNRFINEARKKRDD
jgi:hypothetical protein